MLILGLPRSRTNPASVPPWYPRSSRLRPTRSGRSGGRRGPSSSAPMRAPGSAARPSDRRRHLATARRRCAAGRAPGKWAADARHRPRPAGPNASSSTHSSGPPRGASNARPNRSCPWPRRRREAPVSRQGYDPSARTRDPRLVSQRAKARTSRSAEAPALVRGSLPRQLTAAHRARPGLPAHNPGPTALTSGLRSAGSWAT